MIVGQGARRIAAGMGLAYLFTGTIERILFEVDVRSPASSPRCPLRWSSRW